MSPDILRPARSDVQNEGAETLALVRDIDVPNAVFGVCNLYRSLPLICARLRKHLHQTVVKNKLNFELNHLQKKGTNKAEHINNLLISNWTSTRVAS